MTGRDLRWRAIGVTLAIGGCGATLLDREGSPAIIIYFLAAILGLVLMINGKRVAIVWQAERRGHPDTAAAVHAGRLRRYRRKLDRQLR